MYTLVKVTAYKKHKSKGSVMITWIDTEYDSGAENLVDLMDEHCELQSEIVTLCNSFVEDVGEKNKNT